MNGKKILSKENLAPVLVLLVICLAAALLMSVVNLVTAPAIEQAEKDAANAAMKVVLPEGTTFTEMELTDGYPDAVTKAYKSDAGYVFQTKTSGNKPGIVAMCGVNNDGKLVGVEIISDEETPSYKSQIFPLVTGTEGKYAGQTADTLKPELVSGATKSSTGIYNAVKAALGAFVVANGGTAPEGGEDEELTPAPDTVTPVIERTTDEMLAIAMTMYDGEVTLETVSLYNPDPTTVAVYKNPADESYVLYLGTRTQYTPLETEAAVLVDKAGKILDVNLITWNVGHGVEVTPEYLESMISRTKYDLGSVELVTGATVTAQNLVTALEGALRDVFADVALTDAEIERLAYKATPHNELLERMELPADAPDTVKALFRLTSGRGYVVYTVTSTQYVKYETEAFTYTDINGKVMDVYLATWTVGHGISPSDDFVNSLNGKTADTLSEVELISGATATSGNLVNAVKDALSVIPAPVNYSLITIVVLAVAVLGAVGCAVVISIKRRKRA